MKTVWQPLIPPESSVHSRRTPNSPVARCLPARGGSTSTRGLAVMEASQEQGPLCRGTGRQTQQDSCHSHGAEREASTGCVLCHSICVMFWKRPSSGDSHFGVAWGTGGDCRARGLPGRAGCLHPSLVGPHCGTCLSQPCILDGRLRVEARLQQWGQWGWDQ